MIEMLRIYSKGLFENVTIEELTPWPFLFGWWGQPRLIVVYRQWGHGNGVRFILLTWIREEVEKYGYTQREVAIPLTLGLLFTYVSRIGLAKKGMLTK